MVLVWSKLCDFIIFHLLLNHGSWGVFTMNGGMDYLNYHTSDGNQQNSSKSLEHDLPRNDTLWL